MDGQRNTRKTRKKKTELARHSSFLNSAFDVRRSVFGVCFLLLVQKEKGALVSESALHIKMAISRILSG